MDEVCLEIYNDGPVLEYYDNSVLAKVMLAIMDLPLTLAFFNVQRFTGATGRGGEPVMLVDARYTEPNEVGSGGPSGVGSSGHNYGGPVDVGSWGGGITPALLTWGAGARITTALTRRGAQGAITVDLLRRRRGRFIRSWTSPLSFAAAP